MTKDEYIVKEVIASWKSYPSKWKRIYGIMCIHCDTSIIDLLLREILPSKEDAAYITHIRLRVWKCIDCGRQEFWLLRCLKARELST